MRNKYYNNQEHNLTDDNDDEMTRKCEICGAKMRLIRETVEAYGSDYINYEWQCPNCG